MQEQLSILTGNITIISKEIVRNNSNYYWRGELDDIRIYSKSLSLQEIENLYTSGSLSTHNFKLNNTIELFPNPSRDFIKVSELTTKKNYTIFTVLGSEIKRGSISNNETIDIRNLTRGPYFLKLDNENSIKFIKE